MSNAIQIIGTVVGVVAGAIIGVYTGGAGFALVGYALMGAAVGFGIGSMIAPTAPDTPAPGEAQWSKLDMPSANEGIVVPDVLGTTKSVGNIFWYANNRVQEIKEKVKMGKKKKWVTTGYEYYLTWAQGLCMGPVDTLLTIYRHEDVVWSGELERDSTGMATITLAGMGVCQFYYGTYDQPIPTVMQTYGTLPATNSGYRGLCYVLMVDCLIGEYNRCPVLRFVYRRSPALEWLPNPSCPYYDYNPAAAIWYILENHTELDTEEFLDQDEFALVAQTLLEEARGISLLMMTQTEAITYIEGILTHINALFFFDIDSKFHLKLLRDDEETENMKSYTEADFVEPPIINRTGWVDVINEVQVQYTRRKSKTGDVFSWEFINESVWWDPGSSHDAYCYESANQCALNGPIAGSSRGTWDTDSALYFEGHATKQDWMGEECNHISVVAQQAIWSSEYGRYCYYCLLPYTSQSAEYGWSPFVTIYQQVPGGSAWSVTDTGKWYFINLFNDCIARTRYGALDPGTFLHIVWDTSEGGNTRGDYEPAINEFLDWLAEEHPGVTVVEEYDVSERWLRAIHKDLVPLGYTGF